MKKIILLLFALFLSFSAYCQFPNPGIEGFENTAGPDLAGSVPSPWTLGTGVPGNQWAVFSNNIGTGRWTINSTLVVPPVPPIVHEGANSAYMNRVQAGGAGITTENYLVTPLVTVPQNGQLRFYSRTFTQGNQGTFYDVKISTTSQTSPAAYTTTLATFTEDQLTLNMQGVQNAFNIYTQKIINFPPNLIGTQLYVAFVRRNTQVGTGIDGDRWLLDAVQLNERCLDPTTLAAGGLTDTSAQLSWGNPSGATSWEIEILPAATLPTGAGVLYNGALPYLATTTTGATPTALAPLTCYKYYVRAVCPGSIASEWVGPFNFCTTVAPPVCGGNFVDPGGATGNYPNNVTATSLGTTTICPSVPGEQVTVTFTAFSTQANNDVLTVYDGSIATPGALIGNYSGNTLPPVFTSSAADGCLTFVFISNGTVTAPGWVANVTCAPPPPCQKPTGLNAIAINPTSINLGWTNVGPGTAWQYIVLPAAAPAPAASTNGTDTPNNPTLIGGLTPGTCFNVYVRSDCTSTSNGLSAWSNVFAFCTPVEPPVCGGNYVDSGSTTAPYSGSENSIVTICPLVLGEEVTVTFTSFNTEATWDGIYVYSGSGIAAPSVLMPSANPAGNAGGPLTLPGAYWGAAIPGPFTGIAANGGCLTFHFLSDPTQNNPGWLADVTCAPPPLCPKPINLTQTTPPVLTHNSVSLAWTNVGPATSWEVIAVPCTSPPPTATTPGWVAAPTNPFVLTGLNPTQCYNIYVRGNCGTDGVSFWSTPITVTTPVAPPICGGMFVDAGGTANNYPNNSNSTVTICPTVPGDVVTVTFTAFNVEANDDGLYVYDGQVVTPAALIPSANPPGTGALVFPGAYWGNAIPGPFTSTVANGCLTFVFISDAGTANPGWAANITCSPAPTCSKPMTLTATAITQTSAQLNWTQPLNPDGSVAGAWEVFVLPAGSPIPVTSGIPVSTNSYLATGLAPGLAYVFYVRAICSPTDSSTWAALTFATNPVNDECSGAIFAIVNQNLTCVQTTPGTLAGATGSLPVTTCPGVANDDVWFTFTATAATHVISFNNVVPATALNYAIYQGTCTGLTQVGTCNSGAGLTAGTTYFIRVYSASAVPQLTNFSLCIGTLPCTEAPAFCTGQTVTYANTVGVPSLGAIGCLATAPNPAFFFLQVNQAGPLTYLISQVNTAGTPIDVDYAAWGPFTNLSMACSGVPANPLPGLIPALTPAQGCAGTLHACSYSAAPTEIMCIPNAQLCQVYVIMITNFNNNAGTVTFTQTNTGGGTTECFPINTFNYPQTYYCQSSPNPTPVLAPGAASGTYSSTPGLVIDPVTGTINLLASTPGNYIVTSTTLTSTGGACSGTIPSIVTTRTVIITAPASATISYPNSPYCKAITTLQPVTRTGTAGGTYSAAPAGLLIDAISGGILPVSSAPGTYTVTYTVAATGGCPAFTTTTQVVILPSIVPLFTQVQAICPGTVLAPLPTTSNNGIVGTWSPAINNTATTTYTFTPTVAPGACISTTIMTIVVGSTTPSFTQVAPICAGETLAALPTSSNNTVPVTGTWSPAINNMATTTYTFTPTPGVCASVVTMTILVNPAINVTVNSTTLCSSGTATVTATPAIAGSYIYVWTVPQGVPNPGNVASFTTTTAGTYTVVISQTNSFCNSDFENPVGTLGSLAFVNQTNFPCWGTTATDGMIEVWTNGTENTFAYSGTQFIELNANQVSTLFQNLTVVPGTSATLSFAHRGRFSGIDVLEVQIGPVGGPYTSLGQFSATPSAWVYNTVTYVFPNNSVTNYTIRFVSISSGSGSLTVGNFIDAVSLTGIGCSSVPTSGTVTFTTPVVPTFDPIANICIGQTAPALPTSSTNTTPITGTWSPATINTSALGTTIYNFTPTAGQCASAGSLSVTIAAPSIAPTFNQIAAICQGLTPPALPSSSTNTPPISGTWSPSTIDTSVPGTTTYTFTPTAAQCGLPTTMDITVLAPTPATFTQIAAVCQGGTAPTLPATSGEGIAGTWSPATVSTATAGTTTYTFTPNTGSCAVGTTMNITIHPRPVVGTFSNVYACESYTLPALPAGSNYFSQTGGQGPITNLTLTSNQTVYVLAQSSTTPVCTDQTSFTVTITQDPEFSIQGGCQLTSYVLEVVNATFDATNATYLWSGPVAIPNNGGSSIVITTPGVYTCVVSIPNGTSGTFCTNAPITFNATQTNCAIPKGISPNGDTRNDTLDLTGYNVGKLGIFNRYGKEVYSKLDYVNEWGGQSDSGNELPDGTYYYVIESKIGGDTQTGWIYINREIK